MILITTKQEYNLFINKVKNNNNLLIIPTFTKHLISNYNNELLFTYICLFNSKFNVIEEYILNQTHYDILFKHNIDFIQHKNIFTLYKTKLKHHINKNNKLYDIQLLKYLFDVELFEINNYNKIFKQYYYKHEYNQIIPITKHIETLYNKELIDIVYKYKNEIDNNIYVYYNNLLDTLYDIEKQGIYINSNKFKKLHSNKLVNHTLYNNYIFSEYNLYTTTGRPSNRFGGINFNALNKKTDRDWIVSRYQSEGKLIEFDYSGYHLSILAYFINYKFPEDVKNPHVYLGSQYFETTKLTEKQYKQTKELNFKFLYGKIPKEVVKGIRFFNLVDKYITKIYNNYMKTGYVESPISSRKISNIETVTPNKVLNYLIQMVETELTITNINKVIQLIKNKKIHIILYTYDSILIDIHNNEFNIIDNIKEVLEDSKFKITIKQSDTNYAKLK